MDCSPWGRKESDTTEQLALPFTDSLVWRAGLVALSCAGSQFLSQGLNPHPLRCKADSQPLDHQGKSLLAFLESRIPTMCVYYEEISMQEFLFSNNNHTYLLLSNLYSTDLFIFYSFIEWDCHKNIEQQQSKQSFLSSYYLQYK